MTTIAVPTPSTNGHHIWPIDPIVIPTPTIPAAAAEEQDSAERDKLDAELAKAVRSSGYMRQLFYFVVLIVALAGQVSGAVQALGIPLIWAIPAVGALELGGIVVLANADVRRRLGEKATASRILSAAIAAFAVAFNWMAHDNKLMAGFFAGMSALGYLVWLMHTENQRRDRLRAKGDLPQVTPAYEVVGHWLRHPWLTLRAKNLAKANPKLGLYTSIDAAKAEKRKEQRTSAIAKVLHRKIRSAVDPTTADIAAAVYDLDEIAVRLADGADYDGLTALIAKDLQPDHLAEGPRKVPSVVGEPITDAVDAAFATSLREMGGPTPTLEVGGPAHAQSPTPTLRAPIQPTPTLGGGEPAQADTPTWAGPPTPSRTPTPSRPTAQVGEVARPTPSQPRAPKPPTRPKAAQPMTPAQGAQPTGAAHAPTPMPPGLTELQQQRYRDLDREFPGAIPGRDKAMDHMKARGYSGWSSKEPAKTLINLLRAQREAQGAQPTPTAQVGDAQPSPVAQPTDTPTPTEGEQ